MLVDGGLVIEDLSLMNGVFVNGVWIEFLILIFFGDCVMLGFLVEFFWSMMLLIFLFLDLGGLLVVILFVFGGVFRVDGEELIFNFWVDEFLLVGELNLNGDFGDVELVL